MSMTREEASKHLFDDWYIENGRLCVDRDKKDVFLEAVGMGIKALHPVSREQVEKVWRGCEYCKKHKINLVRIEMDYNDSPGSPERLNPTRIPKFCPICGAPMTDEAVEMVMERLEALKDETD